MSGRRLRFTERTLLASAGSLGDLASENVPPPLRGAFSQFLSLEKNNIVDHIFDHELEKVVSRHWGHGDWRLILATGDVGAFCDLVEMVAELAPNRYPYGGKFHTAIPHAETTINELFDRHRFGYALRDGEIHPVSSPALSHEIVGPALLAIARPGWDQVEARYREALAHLRNSSETAEALTSASASVEAALKAIGMKGQTLSALAKAFSRTDLIPGHNLNVMPLLVDLVERLEAWRSAEGSAHGKHTGAEAPPRALAALAVHWAGAFLAYLASTVDETHS